jgi:hypothetical protein
MSVAVTKIVAVHCRLPWLGSPSTRCTSLIASINTAFMLSGRCVLIGSLARSDGRSVDAVSIMSTVALSPPLRNLTLASTLPVSLLCGGALPSHGRMHRQSGVRICERAFPRRSGCFGGFQLISGTALKCNANKKGAGGSR